MRNTVIGLAVVAALAGNVMGADVVTKKVEKLIQTVQEGCSEELGTYCKGVTPGEGRVLACLYAFEDKLSSRCEYALYDVAAQLQQAVVKLTYVANECKEDLQKYCSGVEPGQGRILDCMKKNEKKVSQRCNQAIKDTVPKS